MAHPVPFSRMVSLNRFPYPLLGSVRTSFPPFSIIAQMAFQWGTISFWASLFWITKLTQKWNYFLKKYQVEGALSSFTIRWSFFDSGHEFDDSTLIRMCSVCITHKAPHPTTVHQLLVDVWAGKVCEVRQWACSRWLPGDVILSVSFCKGKATLGQQK
jgi:hypothetical protein